MRLLNRSFSTLSISLLLIIGIWSVVFYLVLIDEIYDSIDDSLEEYKEHIIDNARLNGSILGTDAFDNLNYVVQQISREKFERLDEDVFEDTLISRDSEEDPERMRTLTSVFELDGKYYQLQIISSMVEEDDLIERFAIFLLILYGVVLLSIFVINNVLLRRLWNPFYAYLLQLKNFRFERHPDNPQMDTNTLEFVELNKACDELINYARSAYANQKQFIENAAHELQTPLAVIQSKLELLLERHNLNPTDAETVVEIFHKVRQLFGMNRSLLLLSKIENKQFFDNQSVRVDEVIRKVVSQFEDFAENKAIHLKLEDMSETVVDFDPTLMEILMSNLIKNAIVHNQTDGSVNVNLIGNRFKICNSSVNPPLSNQVFERFYTKSGSGKGTGLGLAIVQAICKLYGLTIHYSYHESHCFEIKFK